MQQTKTTSSGGGSGGPSSMATSHATNPATPKSAPKFPQSSLPAKVDDNGLVEGQMKIVQNLLEDQLSLSTLNGDIDSEDIDDEDDDDIEDEVLVEAKNFQDNSITTASGGKKRTYSGGDGLPPPPPVIEPLSIASGNSTAISSSSGNFSAFSATSSTTSSNTSSSSSQALPPVTYDQIHRNRFTGFYESFFSTEELERFFPDRKVRLAIITWNMSSKPPIDYNQSLQELLHLNASQRKQPEFGPQLPEIFVIGLQETPTSETVVDNIKIGIQSVLGPSYALLRWSAVGVLHAAVWIRRELLWSCTTVEMVPIHMRPVAANRIKTKGAVAFSFCLFGTSFLFINTHLAAHEINLRARMNQLDKVQQILNLKTKPPETSDIQHNGSWSPPTKSIHDSEYIFWFGDLNFRLELPSEIVLDAIKRLSCSNDTEVKRIYLHKMIRSDQLSNLMARGLIFQGFREALWPPPFLPTYKCKTTNNRNNNNAGSIEQHSDPIPETSSSNPEPPSGTSSSASTKSSTDSTPPTAEPEPSLEDFGKQLNYETNRVPSYTDRILYQCCDQPHHHHYQQQQHRNCPVHCLYYNSIQSLTTSDHKPVYAQFEVTLVSSNGGVAMMKRPLTIKRLSQLVNEENRKNGKNSSSPVDGQTTNSNFQRLVNKHLFGGGGKQSGNNSTVENEKENHPNTRSTFFKLDRVGQLNAGAYERRIYIEGLRLRNNLLQSSSMENLQHLKRQNTMFRSHSFESNLEDSKKPSPLTFETQKQTGKHHRNSEPSRRDDSNRPNSSNRTSNVCSIG